MTYANALRDVDDNAVTVFSKKSVTIQEVSHKMPLKTCQELVEILRNIRRFSSKLEIWKGRIRRIFFSGTDNFEGR